MRRGDLDDLAAFATVARTRSFTRAGAELGLSPSALSHAMKSLELRLGVRLLARTTRSVAPTSAGEQLLRSLDPALTEVARGLSRLADWRDTPAGAVRLATFGWAARTILAPRLPAFLLDHPDISVEVIVEDRLIDLVAGGFDAGIRLAQAVEGDMISVPVLLPWEFEEDGRDIKVRVAGQLIVNDEALSAAAVRAGAGLGYMMEEDVADEIRDGRLVQVLGPWCPAYPGCRLYYPDRRVSPAMRALVDALRWQPN
ncbi:MAG: LysR family transcriptional regulator [Tardiphaga sp.]